MSAPHPPPIDFRYDEEISLRYIDYKQSTVMSNITVEYLLDIAPCPPAWDPGLLYRTPYPVNLTEEEVDKIAQRCKVPPNRQTTPGGLSVKGNPPDVLLYVLVTLSVTSFVVLVAAGLIYR
jgi:hypothetical protein